MADTLPKQDGNLPNSRENSVKNAESVSGGVTSTNKTASKSSATVSPEIGGPKGPEPTRYGDWERNGRCSDF